MRERALIQFLTLLTFSLLMYKFVETILCSPKTGTQNNWSTNNGLLKSAITGGVARTIKKLEKQCF